MQVEYIGTGEVAEFSACTIRASQISTKNGIDVATFSNKTFTSPRIGNTKKSEKISALSFLEHGNQYVLDLITDTHAIEGLKSEWQALEQSCAEPFIYFQSYDWCKKWCDVFCSNSGSANSTKNAKPKIRIYALWRNSKLIMVWPLMLTRSRANLHNLTFLSEPHGQYGNIICDRKLLSVKTGKKVWNYIRANSDADAITLDKYPQSSMLKQIVDGDGLVENSERHSSILNLEGFENWEEYRSSLSRKTRKQRNQRRNKLAKIGEITYEVHFGGSPSYERLLQLALHWKNIWLRETGRRTSVLSDADTKRFLTNLDGSDKSQSRLVNGATLGVLSVANKPIGIELGMCLDGHYYSYLGAFDWENKRLSPGKTQIEEAQMWAKEVGLKKFDFLGDPSDYKTAWTDLTDALESRSVPVTLRGFIYCVCWKAYLRPMAAFVFNRLDAKNRRRILKLFGINVKDKSPASEASNTTVQPALSGETVNTKN